VFFKENGDSDDTTDENDNAEPINEGGVGGVGISGGDIKRVGVCGDEEA
jgi:hypothetical protein